MKNTDHCNEETTTASSNRNRDIIEEAFKTFRPITVSTARKSNDNPLFEVYKTEEGYSVHIDGEEVKNLEKFDLTISNRYPDISEYTINCTVE